MPYVITDACIDVKDKTCLDACPVDCIYEGGRTLYIQPDECIDCGLCETVCPVAAIHADDRLPEELKPWIAVNREFFGPEVTGWGRPGGADAKYTTTRDHPMVAAWPRKPAGAITPLCSIVTRGRAAAIHRQCRSGGRQTGQLSRIQDERATGISGRAS